MYAATFALPGSKWKMTIFLSPFAVRLLDIKVPVVGRWRCRWIADPRTYKEEGIGCHVVLVTWDSLHSLVGNLEPASEQKWESQISNHPRNSHRSGSMLQREKLDRQGLVEWQVPDLVWKSLTPGGFRLIEVDRPGLLRWLFPKLSKSFREIVKECQRLVILSSVCLHVRVWLSAIKKWIVRQYHFGPTRLHWHSIHPKPKGNLDWFGIGRLHWESCSLAFVDLSFARLSYAAMCASEVSKINPGTGQCWSS